MKRYVWLFLWTITFLPVQTVSAVQAGEDAPLWQAADLEGNIINFPPAGTGQTTVLVFWATWCPYCKVFMPRLDGIETDYGSRGLRVMAVNCKEEEDGDPAGYIKSHGYKFTTVLDGDSIAELYSVKYIPGLLIIGRDGKVVYRRKSTDLPAGREVADFWDSEVRAVLDNYLN